MAGDAIAVMPPARKCAGAEVAGAVRATVVPLGEKTVLPGEVVVVPGVVVVLPVLPGEVPVLAGGVVPVLPGEGATA